MKKIQQTENTTNSHGQNNNPAQKACPQNANRTTFVILLTLCVQISPESA
jgi:hypothetical protein